MIKKIRKIDGSIVEFEQEKITNAILKAINAVNSKDGHIAGKLSDMVVEILEFETRGLETPRRKVSDEKKFKTKIPSVENVQDIVEKVLIEEGYSDVAKAYILYRKKRRVKKTLKKIRGSAESYAKFIILGLVILLFLSVIRASLFSEVPEEKRIWFELSFLLLAAISAELLVVYLKQPMVMILLLLGVFISPSAISMSYPYISGFIVFVFSVLGLEVSTAPTLPHLVPTEGTVRIFAQLGSIFLLFKIGLHSEIKQIFNSRNFLVGFVGVLIPFIGGYYYAVYTGHGFNYAMFLGAALTATSVGVTVAVLHEFNVLDRDFAKIILGAAVIDDILALLVLSIVENFPSALDIASISPLLSVLAMAAIFVVGGIRLGQYIVSRYFDRSSEDGKIPNTTFLGILVYVLSYAYVAEFIGLSAIVGAFIAGITLNYSRITGKLFELFYPLEAFFTPIFFISLGMFVDISALVSNIVPILIITLIAIATKLFGCGIASRLSGANAKDSILVGLGMIPRGEIALIIGLFGLTATTATGEPLLHATEYSIIASMAFLTTVIVPVVLQRALSMLRYR